MRKNFLLLFVYILILSCSNQDVWDSDIQSPVKKQVSSIRSYEEALQIAKSSISIIDGSGKTRSVTSRQISLDDSKICLAGSKTRSANGNDTLMYVFNFEENQGFVVVSANRATEELIAITESGNYNPDEPSDIDGFNLYMELAKNYILNSRGPGLDPIIPYERDSFAVVHNYVGPYVTVNWGQTNPEGEFCSNGICGCSNTAIAQIMSYYEYPSSTPITYNNRDVNYQLFDWTQMKDHQTGHARYNSICSSDDVHTSIARLCRQSGYIAGSYYDSNSTGTTLSGKISALQFFGYITNSWTYYSNASIKDTLNAGYPMIICGWDYSGSNVEGHAWVMDGYHEIIDLHYGITKPFVGSDEEEVYLIDSTYSYLYHFNWGWYGLNNGYYSYNVFDTDMGTYDGNHQTLNYNFDHNVQILCPHPLVND